MYKPLILSLLFIGLLGLSPIAEEYNNPEAKHNQNSILCINENGTSIRMAKSMLREGAVVYAKKPDGFDFDANFKVTGFKLIISDKGVTREFRTTGNKITKDMANAIRKVKVGENIIFADIIAVGPDNIRRVIGPLVVTIQ